MICMIGRREKDCKYTVSLPWKDLNAEELLALAALGIKRCKKNKAEGRWYL